MRILLVSQEYPPETAHGGIATQARAKARGLAARGHEVHVLSCAADGRRREGRDGGVAVTRIAGLPSGPAPATEAARWLLHSVAVAAELDALLDAFAPDVVEFPEYGAEGYAHLLNRSPETGPPAVVHLHGPLVMLAHALGWPARGSDLYRVGTHMEATCLRLADAVYSSSRRSADWCVRHYGFPDGDVPVLHTGVDVARFAPREPEPGTPPRIVFVGRLAASKGADLVARAGLRLAHDFPGLRVELVGRGEPGEVERLRRLAADAGRPGTLELPGPVPHHELPARLARAHAFAAPSRYEGGPGFVVLEAMACGLPVVACRGSGMEEVVEDGAEGLLVPADDPEAVTGALRTLLADAESRRAMGRRARRRVEAEADAEVCLDRLEAYYRDVAERGRREAGT